MILSTIQTTSCANNKFREYQDRENGATNKCLSSAYQVPVECRLGVAKVRPTGHKLGSMKSAFSTFGKVRWQTMLT